MGLQTIDDQEWVLKAAPWTPQTAASFAHNLNNVLSIIVANSQLLGMRARDKSSRMLSRDIELACEMLVRMNLQAIHFAKQDHRPLQIVSMKDLANEVRRLVRAQLPKALKLRLNVGKDLPMVFADRSSIEQAIMNLAKNAADAMPQRGKLTITFSLACRSAVIANPILSKNRDYVSLKFCDTGHGMTETVREKALAPFFSTKAPHEGSGLGLSTVVAFARELGGDVTIKSQPASGTTVTVFLPAKCRSSGPR